MVGIVRALDDMAVFALRALSAVAECSERTTNVGSRGDVDMGIAACIVRAVAAKEMCAGWSVRVSGCVAEVAVFPFGAG